MILLAQKLSGQELLSTLPVIKHIGHVQIDTISVVERAHHHTLWTRNKNYKTSEIDELMAKRNIFEYWSHAASYLPIQSYRYCLPRMRLYQTGKNHWFKADKKTLKYVLDTIKAEGAKKAGDFKSERKNSEWFDWAPAKKALEQLFMDGTLMVSQREGFHKVYDLKENVLPQGLDTSYPSDREFAEFLILSQLQSQAIASGDEISYQRGAQTKLLVAKTLAHMLEDKKLIQVKIEKSHKCFYLTPDSLTNLEQTKMNVKQVHILSPFDNLVIQRKRLKYFFDFDYQIECYIPSHKRKYGYFCLPLLVGDQFVGRMDAKADRKSNTFIVKKIFYEQADVKKSVVKALEKKIKEFADFNSCSKLIYES